MNNTLSPSIAEINVSYKPKVSDHPCIKSSQDAYTAVKKFFSDDTIALQEQFAVMYLNRYNKVLGVFSLSKGGITSTVADTRLIISVALKTAAVGIILAHNHPSGNLTPSETDKQLTAKIKMACKLMDINLLDHIILTPDGKYYSFIDEGDL